MHHKGVKRGVRAQVFRHQPCAVPSLSTRLLWKEGGDVSPGRSGGFHQSPAVVKSVSSLSSHAPPRGINRDLGRARGMAPIVHRRPRKDRWGKGFDLPLRDVRGGMMTWFYFKGTLKMSSGFPQPAFGKHRSSHRSGRLHTGPVFVSFTRPSDPSSCSQSLGNTCQANI